MKKLSTLFFVLAALLMLTLTHAAADDWDLRLPPELTEIGEAAFAGDTSLNTVYLDDSVTSIGARAFADSSLRDIRLPENLTELAPDAFLNVPHVEVYGTWNEDFLAGMDNVSKSGELLPERKPVTLAAAAGQEIFRRISVNMTGRWYIGIKNCSGAALYTAEGEKIEDLSLSEETYYIYHTFTEPGEIFLSIRNDSDAMVQAEAYVEAPFSVQGIVSKQQAEYKGSSLSIQLYVPSLDFNLSSLDAHQYYAPAIRTTFDRSEGATQDYDIRLYVDDKLIQSWKGTFTYPENDIHDFLLEPESVMKYQGFGKGEHSVRIEANGAVTEFSYSVSGTRKLQGINPAVTSLYILPDQHSFSSFTAEAAGVYTFRSDVPVAKQLYARLTNEEGNVLDSKEADGEDNNFILTATLAEGQTVNLEVWFALPQSTIRPFYGVVPLIVNEPSAEGSDIFANATLRALVIGQTYEAAPKEISRLPGCRNDADSMANMLANLTGSPYYVKEYIDLTAEQIRAAVPEAFAEAAANDVSLFYYSGHGATGSGSLVGSDGEYVKPTELKAVLDQVPGTKIIILDSCFSGYFIGRGEDEAGAAEALSNFLSVFSFSSRGAGSEYYVLTASSLYETSIGYKGGCSLFTKHLIGGMGCDPDNNGARVGSGPADIDGDGMYTMGELYVYCRDNVRAEKTGQTVCPWPYNSNQVIFIDEFTEPLPEEEENQG